jgi:hypothetical protein
LARFKQFTWGGRKRRLATVIAAALMLVSTTALAVAFFVGAMTGQAGGKVAGNTAIGNLELSQNTAAAGALSPGHSAAAAFDVFNPTTGQVTIKTVTVGGIASNPSCNVSAIHFTGTGLVNLSFPPGTTTGVVVPNAWSADANLDVNCAGAALGVALSGTTEGTGP